MYIVRLFLKSDFVHVLCRYAMSTIFQLAVLYASYIISHRKLNKYILQYLITTGILSNGGMYDY